MPQSKPKILIVGAFPPPESKIFGGIVTSCKVLLASSLPDKADLTLIDSTQISNPPPGLRVRLWLAMKRVMTFIRLFEKKRPDAVILFTSVGASIVEKGFMGWYARLRGKPALMFPRGGALLDQCEQSRFVRTWVKLCFSGSKMLLCQGPMWQRFAMGKMGFSAQMSPILPNWTATPEKLAIGKQCVNRMTDSPIRLIFVGWVEENKGIFELIEVCRQLSDSHSFVLNIVGHGRAVEAIESFLQLHNLTDRVVLSGWLQGADLDAALADADVFLLPSWAEGFPNAMIEAMAARLTVIVSAVGNIPDFLTDEEQALLVPAKEPAALREALTRVLEDKALRLRLAENGHLFAEQQFSAERVVERLLSAVEQVT